jgi:hypothetical protein
MMILFDDPAALSRAEQIRQHLQLTLAPDLEIEEEARSFDSIQNASEALHAAHWAAGAALVLLSTSSGRLSQTARDWMDLWLTLRREHQGETALIGLSGSPSLGNALHEELREIAMTRGITYFGQTFVPPPAPPHSAEPFGSPSSCRTCPPATPRFGINE